MSDLAKRAVACKHWRWMPGSAFDTGLRYDGFAQFMLDDWEGEIPDLTDPATLGCLSALVREAWDGCGAPWTKASLSLRNAGGCTMKYGKKPVNDSSA